MLLRLPRNRPSSRFFCAFALLLAVCLTGVARAEVKPYPLGEFIMRAIEDGQPYTASSLLIMTQNLPWFAENAERLPAHVRAHVQQLRINVVALAADGAAGKLNEPAARFFFSGSCNAVRDIDLLYVGEQADRAVVEVNEAIRDITGKMFVEAGDDTILAAAEAAGHVVPRSLSSEALEVVTTHLPNFGYQDAKRAFERARAAAAAGDPDAIKVLERELLAALEQNLDSQVATRAGKDYYAGGSGQRHFVSRYLGDPDKVRAYVHTPQGARLIPGGPDLIPGALIDQVLEVMPTNRRTVFAKVATDYALFFRHGEDGGLRDIAKYVDGIWNHVDEKVLLTVMTEEENIALFAASMIAKYPDEASELLATFRMTERQVRAGVQTAMFKWVEKQLVEDVGRLVTELDRVAKELGAASIDDIEALYRKGLVKFDLNDLANGLAALSDLPDDGSGDPAKLLAILKDRYGGGTGGAAIAYIEAQLEILADTGFTVQKRILKALVDAGEIANEDFYDFRARLAAGVELPPEISAKLRQARREMLLLATVDMLEAGDEAATVERIVAQWRQQHSTALISTATPEIVQTVRELQTLSANELKALGWVDVELELPFNVRARIAAIPGGMAELAERLGARMSAKAIQLAEWQRQLRAYIFHEGWTKFGTEGDLGAGDAVMGAVSGFVQTYAILNSSPPMSPQDESIALGNAWASSLPVVGDFYQAALAGGEFYYTGDRRKALEAGLYVTIGVLGFVPGGQIPAVVLSLVGAAAPSAVDVYRASEAQTLIQAWVESGVWSDETPPRLIGIYDREGLKHLLDYEHLLTFRGEKPYDSMLLDSPLWMNTIAGSLRHYAETFVFPNDKRIAEYREQLKLLYPDFDDKEWANEQRVEAIVERGGGKVALHIFKRYDAERRRSYEEVIKKFKAWAEEERRVADDYDGEVARIKDALARLQAELKVGTLIAHADRSAESYARMVKNAWEQESLPLSRFRIYRHYLTEYERLASGLRQVKAQLQAV